MSVLVSKRKESRFEAIVFSVELHNMLIELMQHNFGIKDLRHVVQLKYAYGRESVEDYDKYLYLLINFKKRIEQLASLLTNNVRAANSIYPTTMQEYEKRRSFQNDALVNCEQLINELQRVVEIFDTDINLYARYINGIDREIGLIKKWRQRDNRLKAHLEQGSI